MKKLSFDSLKNGIKFNYYKFKANKKFNIAYFLPVSFIFMVLFGLMVIVDYYLITSIVFLGLLIFQVIIVFLFLRSKAKGDLDNKKRSTQIMPLFMIFTMLICGIGFLFNLNTYTSSNNSGRLQWTTDTNSFPNGIVYHWEESEDFSRYPVYEAPANVFYFLDLSNTELGDVIEISITIALNVKPSSAYIQSAICDTQFQRDEGFENKTSQTITSFTNSTRRINAVNTSVAVYTFAETYIHNENFKQYYYLRTTGNIDPAWIGDNYVSYLWMEITFTLTVDGSEIQPVTSGYSYDMISLKTSVSETWWLISLSMLMLWLMVFIISMVVNNPNAMVSVQIMLILGSIMGLFMIIIVEMQQDYWGDIPWPINYLNPILQIVVGGVKWMISMGIVIILTTIMTVFLSKSIGMGGKPGSPGG